MNSRFQRHFGNVITTDRYRRHRDSWISCTRCPLHKHRDKVVLFRGTIPCQVLFIGEAPGKSEDTFGMPFVGEAGQFLQDRIDEICAEVCIFTYALTNVVACVPLDIPEDLDSCSGSPDIRPPSPKESEACSTRLSQFIVLARPQLIVPLGRIAMKYLPLTNFTKIPVVNLPHPSSILQTGGNKRTLDEKLFRVRLSRAISETFANV